VSAAVTIVAVPVAALTLLGLLRSRFGFRLVAEPSGERWHERTTPTFGGVGIYAGFLVAVALALAVDAVDPSDELFGILGGATLLFLAGLADDLWHLGPVPKLGAQLAAAGLVIASGLRVEIVGNDALALALGLLWLVGITNAFNLLDNMDGLAATLASIACATFAIDAVSENSSDTALVLALSLGFACVTFLPFNLRPGKRARVFMGDSGSQLIGFTLAALALLSNWRVAGATVTTVVLPLLVLAVPILDTTLVTVKRVLERRPVSQGGKDHSSHRLVYYGLSEGRAVGLLAIVAGAVALTGLAYNQLNNTRVTTIGVLVTFVILVQFASALGDLEERSRRGEAAEPPSLRALFFQPKRIAEVVVDFVCVCASFLAAYLLVIGSHGSPYERSIFLTTLPVLLGARYVAFVAFGIYRRVWRFAGSRDALAIVAAVALSELAAWLVAGIASPYDSFPQRIFVVDALLCSALVAASRYAIRLLPEHRGADAAERRVLVVGAGRFGRSLARELRETPGSRVVGFADDNPALRRRRIIGITVLGTLDEMEHLLESSHPDEVLVTIAAAPEERLGFVVRACAAAGIPCRVVRRQVEAVGIADQAIAR